MLGLHQVYNSTVFSTSKSCSNSPSRSRCLTSSPYAWNVIVLASNQSSRSSKFWKKTHQYTEAFLWMAQVSAFPLPEFHHPRIAPSRICTITFMEGLYAHNDIGSGVFKEPYAFDKITKYKMPRWLEEILFKRAQLRCLNRCIFVGSSKIAYSSFSW